MSIYIYYSRTPDLLLENLTLNNLMMISIYIFKYKYKKYYKIKAMQ